MAGNPENNRTREEQGSFRSRQGWLVAGGGLRIFEENFAEGKPQLRPIPVTKEEMAAGSAAIAVSEVIIYEDN